MLWIEEMSFFRLSLVLQMTGLVSMIGIRLLRGETKSICEFLFFTSMFLIGSMTAISVAQGSYDWPIMGITLSVMTVGALVETGESRLQTERL